MQAVIAFDYRYHFGGGGLPSEEEKQNSRCQNY